MNAGLSANHFVSNHAYWLYVFGSSYDIYPNGVKESY